MKNDFVYLDRFVWNKEKAELNKAKHHLSFELACRVFNDPALYVLFDDVHSEEEERFQCIGAIDGYLTIITIIIKEDEPYTRIISARKATKKERDIYEKNARKLQDD